MKKKKRSAGTSVLIVINAIVILVFLLLSAMLVYITATSSSQPKEDAATFLLETEGEAPSLLFLEQKKNYAPGDVVLIRSELSDQQVYLTETVISNDANQITVGSNGASYQEDRDNVLGCVIFESALLGSVLSYISNPEYTVTVVILAGAAFAVVVCLIIITAVLLSRRKKMPPAKSEEEELLERLFRIEEEDDDFIKDVYQQEINEPVELSSAGDDTEPMSEDDLKKFRETVLSGSVTEE